jgi:hypothetical protein
MSALLRKIAEKMSVTPRQVRRWFESGVIRGRKSKGGQWRLARSQPWGNVMGVIRAGDFTKRLAYAVHSAAHETNGGKSKWHAQMTAYLAPANYGPSWERGYELAPPRKPSAEHERAFDIALAKFRLTRSDVEGVGALRELAKRDPNRARLFTEISYADFCRTHIRPEFRRAAGLPTAQLALAAWECVKAGDGVSAKNIARIMGMSRAALYRRFTAEEIASARNAATDGENTARPDSTRKRNGRRSLPL